MDLHTATPAKCPAPAASADLAETVVWLPCRRRGSQRVHRDVEQILDAHPNASRELFLILENLDQLDGSLAGFVLGLEATLRASGRRITIGDVAGFAPLVLSAPEPGSRIRILRTDVLFRRPRPALIVDVSGSCGDVLAGVLDSFGVPRTLVESGPEARRLLRTLEPGLVVADLDHAQTDAFDVAAACRGQRPETGVVGLTFLKDPWASAAAERFGFRRILSKPASIVEILSAIG